mgnify:CR=1 FL=1
MKLNSKNICICIIFIFSIMSCNSQKKEKIKKNVKIDTISNKSADTPKQIKAMKKLDSAQLDKYEKTNKYIENDSVFELRDQGKSYQEIRNKIGEKLTTVSIYDKDKRVLTNNGEFMFDFPIGIHTEYDLKGNVIHQRNYDDDFPFTFTNLKQKLLLEFDIDVKNNILDLRINRSPNPSIYQIILYNERRSKYRSIQIDGINGNTISDSTLRAID